MREWGGGWGVAPGRKGRGGGGGGGGGELMTLVSVSTIMYRVSECGRGGEG